MEELYEYSADFTEAQAILSNAESNAKPANGHLRLAITCPLRKIRLDVRKDPRPFPQALKHVLSRSCGPSFD